MQVACRWHAGGEPCLGEGGLLQRCVMGSHRLAENEEGASPAGARLVGQVGQAESSPGVALTRGMARGGSQISVPCEGFACSLCFNTPLTSSV